MVTEGGCTAPQDRIDRMVERLRGLPPMCPACLGPPEKPRTFYEQLPDGSGTSTKPRRCGHRFHGEYAG